MDLDEALAVHAYLLNVPHEQRSRDERKAFQDAWVTIVSYAKEAIHRTVGETTRPAGQSTQEKS